MNPNIFETFENSEIKKQLLDEMKLCIEKTMSRELLKAVTELRKISNQLTELTKILLSNFCPSPTPK